MRHLSEAACFAALFLAPSLIFSQGHVPTGSTKLSFTHRPVANAGRVQHAQTGHKVRLEGLRSSNPAGSGKLAYSWTFASRPPGSTAELSDASSVTPSFVPDLPGSYELALTVSNDTGSTTARTRVSTTEAPPPVADAGEDRVTTAGSTVVLNASRSTSVSGKAISYSWRLVSVPDGSSASLNNAASVSPDFTADKPGNYVAELEVSDGSARSTPAAVLISTRPVKPVAKTGRSQFVALNSQARLDGSASTDANGLPLGYQWSLLRVPDGSTAALNDAASVNPSFTVDRPGAYVAQLITNNGVLSSEPSTVLITTDPDVPPSAAAGYNRIAAQGSTVQLHGSAADTQDLPLSYHWSLIAKPANSSAVLSNASDANPVFTADQPGTYVAQLVVDNGIASSEPSTVSISTSCILPNSNPGTSSASAVGSTVTLDGSLSANGCPSELSYSWSLTSGPRGSAATLSNKNSATPSLHTTAPGTYVAQLVVNNGHTDSAPMAVAVTAGTLAFSPASINIPKNSTQNLSVTLTPAPTSNTVIALSSANPAVASVPGSVIITANTPGAAIPVSGVAAGATTVSAVIQGQGSGVSAAVTVSDIILPTNPIVQLGETIAFPIMLATPAPPGGVFIALSSSDPSKVSVNTSGVLIREGLMNGIARISGVNFGSSTIRASAQGLATATTTALVPTGTLTFQSPTLSIIGTGTQNLVLSLSPASATDVTVNLSSTDPTVATVPASVVIPANTPTASVPVTPLKNGTTIIHASNPTLPDVAASVSVNGIGSAGQGTITTLILTPNPVTGGSMSNGTVTLSSPAGQNGVLVSLSSDLPSATVPPSITIPANQTSLMFPVITTAVNGTQTATITAVSSNMVTFGLVINPGVTSQGTITNLSISPNPVTGGTPSAGMVTLSAPAGVGGVMITLGSDNGSTSVPSSITISQGQSVGSFPITTSAVNTPQTANISASSSNTVSAPLLVNPGGPAQAQIVSVSVTPNPVIGPAVSNGAVNIVAPAGAGGVIISLSSTNGAATVPPTVTVQPGATTAQFPVNTIAVSSVQMATITASSLNSANATLTINPAAQGAIILPLNLTVPVGQTVAFPVSLPQPAANGVFLSLAVSDSSKASISPLNILIPQNQTSTNSPKITGLSPGTVTVTATIFGLPPVTTTVLISSGTLSFSPASTTINGAIVQPLNLTLSPTPTTDVVLNVSSSDPTVASVPATAVIPAFSNSVTVPVTGVKNGSATIHASNASLADAAASVTVTGISSGNTAIISSVSLLPNPVTGGSLSNGTITLASQAGPNGVVVNLSSNNGSAVVPPSVTVPAGQTTQMFPVNTSVVNNPQTATITVSSQNSTTAVLSINPGNPVQASISSVSVSPNPITGGTSGIGTVTLAAPAASGGVSVTLGSNNAAAPVSGSLIIPAGQMSATFPVNTSPVGSIQTAVISATSLDTATTPLTINPGGPGQATISGLSFAPNPVTGGSPVQATITLAGPAGNNGALVQLGSNNAAAIVSGSITIPAGQSTFTFPVNTTAVSSAQTATISAASANTVNASLTINAAASNAGIILPAAPTVQLGDSVVFPVTLATPAGPNGVFLTLTSSDPAKVSLTAQNIFIPEGQPGSNRVRITGVNFGSATITATATGLAPAMTTAVVPAGVLSFSPTSLAITGATTQSLQLSVAPLSQGAVTLTLTSTDPTVATVPSTLTLPANSSLTVPVTSLKNGTTTIHARGPGLADTSATITVNGIVTTTQGTITNVSFSPNPVAGGQPVTGTVTLASPAGNGGVLVTFASGNPAASVQSSITIPQGQSTGNFAVTTVPVAATLPVSITASSSNSLGSTLTINAPGPGQATLTGVIITPNSVTGGTSATGTVTLAAAAPAGGVLVTLGAGGPVTVPGSITIPVGQMSGNFAVTTVAVNVNTPVVVTATSANAVQATLNVNAPVAGQGTITGLSILPNPVTGGNSATGTVTLAAAAPAGGVLVTLGAGGPVTVPGSITIPVGQMNGTFAVTTTSVGSNTPVVVTAVSGTTVQTTLNVNAPTATQAALASVSILPNPVTGGNSATGTVTLQAAAPAGGALVNLASANNAVTVPGSITIPVGQMSGNFAVTTTAVGSNTSVVVTAVSGTTVQTTLNVNAPTATQAALTSVTIAPNPVTGGNSATGTVTLQAAAPAGGALVNLASANNAVIVPGSITITAGQMNGTFAVTTTVVTVNTPVLVSATSANTVTTTLNVTPSGPTPAQLTSVTVSPNPITGGLPTTGTVNLAAPAGLGGAIISLSATNGVTVPATIPVVTGQSSATFTIITPTVGGAVTSTISAMSANTVTTQLTVNPQGAPLGPFMQQGPKLAGSSGGQFEYEGVSVALSADGNTMIEGAKQDNGAIGAAFVFTRSNGVWTNQAKLVGSGAGGQSSQGYSVSISADGNTALVGGPDDGSGSGAVWVFVRNNGVWTQQGPKLVGTGGVGASGQGLFTALSADGNTAAVGAPLDNLSFGAVWIFTRTNGVWAQQGPKLVSTGAIVTKVNNVEVNPAEGFGVGLSADGNTLIMGSQTDDGYTGAAWIWTRTGGVWTQGPKLLGDSIQGAGNGGESVSVAISGDGNTAMLGRGADSGDTGAVWVFVRNGGAWTQQGPKLVANDANGSPQQGSSVALSYDGNTAIDGGQVDTGGLGAAWVWKRSNGVWSQQGKKLVGTGAIGKSSQGSSVAISSDATTAAVGGDLDNTFQGGVWIFTASPTP